MDIRIWDEQLDSFSRELKVLRYDLRGCGKSQKPEGKFSYNQDLDALLTHLGINNTVVLGVSVGGVIAINYAINYPERVEALVAVSPFVIGYAWSGNAPLLEKTGIFIRKSEA